MATSGLALALLALAQSAELQGVLRAPEGTRVAGAQDPSAPPPFRTLLVEYETSMAMAENTSFRSTRTLYLDGAGSRWAEQFGEVGVGHVLISDGTWRYDVDPQSRTGTKQWLTRYLIST